MKSMFLIFYMLINSMGGYLFQQTAVETAYPDIARRRKWLDILFKGIGYCFFINDTHKGCEGFHAGFSDTL